MKAAFRTHQCGARRKKKLKLSMALAIDGIAVALGGRHTHRPRQEHRGLASNAAFTRTPHQAKPGAHAASTAVRTPAAAFVARISARAA
ncbi:hypothetical protein BURKHO8Y_150112 [Burkholderia sp. 8Y]|nr:hypothetical protein BURKHO8Y_150112 [Burkholderia sp. 8Y]